MTADFRALCAELVEQLDHLNCNFNVPNQSALVERARAALADPEPEGPTDEELRELWNEGWDTSEEYGAFKFARAVLARWGRPAPQPADSEVAELVTWLRETGDLACQADAEEGQRYWSAADLLERLSPPQPVPVSERLPGPEDCDAEGRCWWFCFECPGEHSYWILAKEVYCDPAFWLPAHALPQPS